MKVSYKIAIPLILLPFFLIGSVSLVIIFSLNENGGGSISEAAMDDREEVEADHALAETLEEDQVMEENSEENTEQNEKPKEESTEEDFEKDRALVEREIFIDALLEDFERVSTNPEDYNFDEMKNVSEDFDISNLFFYVQDHRLFIGSQDDRGTIPPRDNYTELFDELEIEAIIILDGIENLPAGFLRGGNVKGLYLGDTLREIAPFAATTGDLEHIQFGEEVRTIGRYAFANNNLQGFLRIPPKVSVIEKRSFSFNQIDYVDLGNVELIEDDSFSSNNLVFVDIPPTTERIGRNAFLPKSLHREDRVHIEHVTFGEQLRIIERDAFLNQRIRHLAFPPTLEFIGDGAFRNSPIETLMIPSEEVILGDRVFTTNIEEVKISGRILATGFNSIQDLENYLLMNE